MILKVEDWSEWKTGDAVGHTDVWQFFEGDHIKSKFIAREVALEEKTIQEGNPSIYWCIAWKGMEGRVRVKLHIIESKETYRMVFAEGMASFLLNDQGETIDHF